MWQHTLNTNRNHIAHTAYVICIPIPMWLLFNQVESIECRLWVNFISLDKCQYEEFIHFQFQLFIPCSSFWSGLWKFFPWIYLALRQYFHPKKNSQNNEWEEERFRCSNSGAPKIWEEGFSFQSKFNNCFAHFELFHSEVSLLFLFL